MKCQIRYTEKNFRIEDAVRKSEGVEVHIPGASERYHFVAALHHFSNFHRIASNLQVKGLMLDDVRYIFNHIFLAVDAPLVKNRIFENGLTKVLKICPPTRRPTSNIFKWSGEQ